MDGKTSGKEHLTFTDAEMSAAASVINAMIAKGVQLDDNRAIEIYARLLDATAEAKIRLKYERIHVPLNAEDFEL